MEIALLEPREEIIFGDVFEQMIKERFFSEIKKRYEITRNMNACCDEETIFDNKSDSVKHPLADHFIIKQIED